MLGIWQESRPTKILAFLELTSVGFVTSVRGNGAGLSLSGLQKHYPRLCVYRMQFYSLTVTEVRNL